MTAVSPVTLNLDGYTDLPPGKIATVVTYLEMLKRPRLQRAAMPEGWILQRLKGDADRYRDLFRRIGEPWLWFSRLIIPDNALRATLDDPRVEAYALNNGAEDIGLLELDFRPENEAKLAFLGLVPEAVGQGAGRFLMSEGTRRAFAKPVHRLFVHTCSLDHPAALGFYIRSGFTPYKRAIEVSDDPRLMGFLPMEAGPHVPVLAKSLTPKDAPSSGAPSQASGKRERLSRGA
jgi:GNAT superfamily N-acetyltransferase